MKRKPYVKTDFDNLSIREACGIAGVSRMTILRWMRGSKFVTTKRKNGQVLIDKQSFMNYLDTKPGERD